MSTAAIQSGQSAFFDVPRLTRGRPAAAVFAVFTFGAASGHGVESQPYTALKGTKAGIKWQL